MKPFLGVLLLVGLVLVYWKFVILMIIMIMAVKAAPVAYREYRGEREARKTAAAELAARADQQHRWASEGDPKGTYGEWTPAC